MSFLSDYDWDFVAEVCNKGKKPFLGYYTDAQTLENDCFHNSDLFERVRRHVFLNSSWKGTRHEWSPKYDYQDQFNAVTYVDHETGEVIPGADVVQLNSVPKWPHRVDVLRSIRSKWINRLRMENASRPCLFITLTIDEEHLDDVYQDPVDYIQRFMKRLRRRNDYYIASSYGLDPKDARSQGLIPRLRYFLVSEHGTERDRYHFHLIMSGMDNRPGMKRFLENVWKAGFCDVKRVNPKLIGYLTKYLFKRDCDIDYICLKSNGIGLDFIENNRINLKRGIVHIEGQAVIADRYTKNKVMTEEERIAFNTQFANERDARIENEGCNIASLYMARNTDLVIYGSDESEPVVFCRKLTHVDALKVQKYIINETLYYNLNKIERL